MSNADIIIRDAHRCVRCGRFVGGDYSVHHRVLGDRADNRASNLILLCGSGTTGCHGWVHANPRTARLSGWIVSKYQRNATAVIAVLYAQPGREGPQLIDDGLDVKAA